MRRKGGWGEEIEVSKGMIDWNVGIFEEGKIKLGKEGGIGREGEELEKKGWGKKLWEMEEGWKWFVWRKKVIKERDEIIIEEKILGEEEEGNEKRVVVLRI